MNTAEVASETFGVFGTTAVLLVTQAATLQAARELADRELAAVDLACSRFRTDSELTRLNESGGAATIVSEVFAALIATALRAARLTDGDVDPTCGRALVSLGYDRDFAQIRAAGPGGGPAARPASPGSASSRPASSRPASPRPASPRPASSGSASPVPGWRSVELDPAILRVRLRDGAQLDLGATAKAWAADRCAELIARRLGSGVLVSLGGDIAVAGPTPADGWQVRVTDDHAAGPDALGQTVTISEGGLATSSTTVRAWTAGDRHVHHIIDPATGEPARSCWRTVSVAAGNCVDANTASTAAIIRGAAAADWLRDAELPARLVRHDGTVETTAGWPRDDEPTTTEPTTTEPTTTESTTTA
jgi:thiamine biosynthesis lipoprotein